MSERGLPPFPTTSDWRAWATQLVEFLISDARSEEFVAPRVVSLLHQRQPGLYRPLEDGLLMYDPSLGVPVFSRDDQWRQFTSQGNINYLVTDDAGNGTVVDDINNTDFTGQQGAVGQCAQCPTNTEVSFYHKGVQYLYAGPTPASYGAGCADTIQDSYLIPVGVGTFLALTDTPASYVAQQKRWPRVKVDETGLEFSDIREADVIDLNRVRWRGNWVQQSYSKNDMVLGDGNWLMIANKDTTDVAPPRPDPDSGTYDLPDVPVWTELTHTGVVESGRIWTVTEPIIVVGYQVWIPELTDDTNYVIKVYRQPIGQDSQREFMQIAEPLLVPNDWSTVSVSRTTVPAGYEIAVIIDALNSGSDTQPGGTPADWVRAENSNNTAPAAGQWNRNNSETLLRIHETDADSNLLDLNGVVAGTTFEIIDTTNPNRSVTYRALTDEIYAGNVYSWTVEQTGLGPQGEPLVGDRTIMTITVPVAAPTKYVYINDGNPTHNWGTSEGYLALDGAYVNDSPADAFGVRIYTEEYVTSPDWDVASSMGTGGSAGGGVGGAAKFTELTDTPEDYASSGGLGLAVIGDESGIEFVDWNAILNFVLRTGDTMTGNLEISKVNPEIILTDTDGDADNKRTRIMQDGNRLRFSRLDDAGVATTLALLDETGWTIRNPNGTWPIMQENGNIKGVAGLFESGVFLRSDSNTGVSFRNDAEEEMYKMIRDVTGNTLDIYKADAGANDRLIGRFDDEGTQINGDKTLVTIEKGDFRYIQQGNAQNPISLGPTMPSSPAHGDQHYLTVQPVGMYVYVDENVLGTGTSAQWVQQNGSSPETSLAPRRMAKYKPSASYAWTFGNGSNGKIAHDETVATVGASFGTMASDGTFTFSEAGVYEVLAVARYTGSIDGNRSRGRGKIFLNGGESSQSQALAYNRNLSGTNYDMHEASTGLSHWLGAVEVGDEIHSALAIEKEAGQGPTVSHTLAQAGTWIMIEKVGD